MRFSFSIYARPPSALKQALLSPLRPKGRRALANRQSVCILTCLGYQIPQVLSSYRPTLYGVYAEHYASSRASELPAPLSPHLSILYTGEVDGPCLLWIVMPGELDALRIQFLRRLGHSTRCNVATLCASWDLGMSPQEHVETAISIIDNLPTFITASRLVLGGSEIGACLALLIVEAKSTGAGAGSFAGAVAGSFDMFCSGAVLVDPFVGWKRSHQINTDLAESRTSLQLKLRMMKAAENATQSQLCDWFPVAHTFVAPPLMILTASDSLWENEQSTFFAQCRGGSRYGNEVTLRQYTIAPAATGTWFRRWETTDVECALGEVESWLRDKAFPNGSIAHTPRHHMDRQHSRISGFQPITPARERHTGPRREQRSGRMVDTISGENINEISEVVVRRTAFVAADAASSLRSIPLVNSYSSVDEN